MTTLTDWSAVALWVVLATYVVVVLAGLPARSGPSGFFGGRSQTGSAPGIWLLAASAAISWVMAKSVNNAMDLAANFGWLGGLGYAAYWLAFVVVGSAIYVMRTRGGHRSLAGFLQTKYGVRAARLFMIVIAIRLFNEVWSNTKVAALYFGAEASAGYWIAALILTALTLFYSLRGGLRSSIVTDGLQMIFLLLLLVVTLAVLAPSVIDAGVPTIANGRLTPGMQASGLTFVVLALVQTLSYGFHDPVMTDRAFLSTPPRMMASFVIAALLGGVCIAGFSIAGLYALNQGIDTAPAVAIAVPLAIGLGLMLLFNAVMLASAGSTLDSVFASTANLGARDWRIAQNAPTLGEQAKGRQAMWLIAIVGNVPLLSVYIDGVGPAVIAATTISGTAIMGLAPIFLLGWIRRAGRASFHLALWPGIVIGVVLAIQRIGHVSIIPSFVQIGTGDFAETLGINVYGLMLCTALFVFGAIIRPRRGLL